MGEMTLQALAERIQRHCRVFDSHKSAHESPYYRRDESTTYFVGFEQDAAELARLILFHRAEFEAVERVMAWVREGETTRNVTIYRYKPEGYWLATTYDEATADANIALCREGRELDQNLGIFSRADDGITALAALAAKLEGG
jgi:hypothetical protein